MSSVIEENLVIRPRRSLKKKLIVAGFYFFIFVIAVIAALYFGYQFGDGKQNRNSQVINSLKQDYDQIKEKYDALLVNEAMLVQTKNVQQSAYVELERTYEIVEQRNEFLNRRVNFYRSILSPKDGVSGIRIHDVSLREETNNLYFEIVLIQSINHSKEATAEVYVELFETKQSPKPIVRWKTSDHDFKFKFSEIVRGTLRAKQGLDGKVIKIIVLPEGDSSKQLVEWHKV